MVDLTLSVSEATVEKLAAVKAEMQLRETLNAELRDMLVWVEETRENADKTLDIAPAPGHVHDKLETLRQVTCLKEILAWHLCWGNFVLAQFLQTNDFFPKYFCDMLCYFWFVLKCLI